ncbi:MAG: D-alanyl-D-alanine carboxypeptidase family protein [Bacillaceae bacterium]
MKKLLVICTVLFSLLWGNLEAKAETLPTLFSPYAVSIDATTGEILMDKGMNQRAYPASMTKVLTALLLMENAQPTDEIVMTKEALAQDKSNYIIDLKEGERLDRDTALDVLMILSANDVAYAIGELVGGSQENFAKMMNERVQELGLKNTHFVTSSGLHHNDHYTTPYEMALITKEAIKNPRIVEAMSTKRKMIKTSRQEVSIFSRHKGFTLADFYCAKTGYTEEALNTLVEVAERDGKKIINVVMKSNKEHYYDDMQKISDYSFKKLEYKEVVKKDNLFEKSVTFLGQEVGVKPDDNIGLFLKKDTDVKVKTVLKKAPLSEDYLYEHGIKENNVVGELIVQADGNEVGRTIVRAANDFAFEKPLALKIKDKELEKNPTMTYAVVGGSLFGGLFIGFVIRKKRRRRRRNPYSF